MLRLSLRLGLVLLPGLAAAVDVNPIPSLTVNPHIRSSVQAFDSTVYAASNGQPLGWTGSVSPCTVGTENQDFIDAGILRVNYYRRLVGLPDVGEEVNASNACRAAALIMDANNNLSHFPPASWTCYSTTGYDAAGHSNIALTSGSFGSGQAIDLYITDNGAGNTAVGHRRWILYPPLTNVGHGDVTQANALWVIEDGAHPTIWGARPATPTIIAWPYAGFFPVARLPGSERRWSYSINGGDFSATTIEVKDDAGTVLTTSKEAYATGYGDNTLVWQTPGVNTAGIGTSDRPYHVLLRGIAGVAGRTATHYSVVLIDATQTRTDEARPTATVAATQATATEGGIAGTFTVTLSANAERDTWVNYALSGTATTTDFTPSGAIKIAAGTNTGTLNITAINDGLAESPESVVINLDPGCSYVVGATSTATVTIVGPGAGPNNPPVITEGATTTLTVAEDTAGNLTLHATDLDAGATFAWSVPAQGSKGTASLLASGGTVVVTYTPNLNANGADSFVILVTDDQGGTDQITVNVTITPVNDAPSVASPLPAAFVIQGTTSTYTVPLGTIIDVDGDTLTWSTPSALAFVAFNAATRTFTFTPGAGDVGGYTIIVNATDGTLSAGVALSLTVAAGADITPPATPAAPSTSSTTASLPTLSGVTENGATIRIYDNGVLVGTAVAALGGGWTWPATAPLLPGAHNMTVTATDASGNTSAMSPPTVITVAGSGGINSGAGDAAGSPACGAGALGLLLALFALGRLRRRRA